MAFLQKHCREKLKMRKNIRWCTLGPGFCDVEIDHLKTRLSSGQSNVMGTGEAVQRV